jgi:hypothetical protein
VPHHPGDGEVLDHLDLLIDFVPVVHLPNTVPPAEEHWGQASLAKVLQVFDELASSDTDSAKASATTGSPVIAVWGKAAGGSSESHEVTPGMMFKLGEGGGMNALDTSKNLAELRNHIHDLSDRAAKIARLPAVAIGTMDPSKAPSGYALELSLGPLDALISSMRLAREHKYALLLKLVQRLYMAGQHPDWVGITPVPARLTFGSYKPTDRAAVLNQVATGVEKGILSLETGVKMLIEAGFPIEDAAVEIEQIQSRQFDKARMLADATGSLDAVAAFLGKDTTIAPEAAPPLQLPPAPGGSGGQGIVPQGSGGNAT